MMMNELPVVATMVCLIAGMLIRTAEVRAQDPTVTFEVQDSLITAPGSQVAVPITVAGFVDVTGFQGTLTWDTEVLQFSSTGSYGLLGMNEGNFGTPGTGAVPDTVLTFIWSDRQATGKTLANGDTVFVLTFDVIGTEGEASAVAFQEVPTRTAVFVETSPVTFQAENGSVYIAGSSPVPNENHGLVPDGYEWSTPYPNPFNRSTRFHLTLATDEQVSIDVTDALGRRVTPLHDGVLRGGNGTAFGLTQPAGRVASISSV